jgi:hypothetical protein
MFDKRTRGFSCKRKCRRWPYAIFSNIVDIATNNGCIIFNSRRVVDRKNECHYDFLKSAGYQLVDKHIRKRMLLARLNQNSKSAMQALGYELDDVTTSADDNKPLKLEKNKRCAFCASEKDRKTSWACPRCKKPRCMEHRSDLCINCAH